MHVRFSNDAREDLLKIEAYLFDHAGEATADQALRRILTRCHQLEARPMLGRTRPDIWSDAGSLLATPWLIVYRVTEGDVETSRIVHQSRDLRAL